MMMPPLATYALLNVLAACALAGLAVVVGRFLRAPGLRHLLWLLVLARLIAPPMFEWGLLPAPEGTGEVRDRRVAEITPVAMGATTVPSPGAATSSPVAAGPIDPASSAVGAPGTADVPAWLWLWGFGALVLATLYGWRWWRFRTSLAEAVPAGAELASRATELAASLGIPTAPEVLLCGGNRSPMVLPALRRPRVLLPTLLVEALTAEELDTVLLHELAHVRRRDYLVRVLETVATVAYWWLPVVWWARSELRAAEELCCDEAVLGALPGSGRAYARGIMKTLELVSPRPGVPALASGMSTFSRMEERLTMIMKPVSRQAFPSRRRLVPLVIAVMTLGVFPTFAERSPQSDEDLSQQARAQQIAIEREALQNRKLQMEFEMRELDAQRDLEAKQARIELDQMDRQAQEFEAAGDSEMAAEIRAAMAHRVQELKIGYSRREMERKKMERMSRHELEAHGKRLEIEALRVAGREVEAEEKLAELAAVEEALEREAMDGRRQEMALEARATEARLENLRAEQARLEAEGRSEDAARLADQIEHSELQRQQMQLERTFEAQQRVLQMKQRSLGRARERAVRERELRQVERRFLDQVRELRRLASRLPDGGSTGRLLEELELEAERLEAESQPPETSDR